MMMLDGYHKAHVIEGHTIQVTAEIKVTPQNIASWFCNMSYTEQAEFFDACGVIAQGWPRPGCFQWHNIAQYTTRSGAEVIKDIRDGFGDDA